MRRIKRYNENADMEQLADAFETSYEAHLDQTRKSGHPYFEHPLEVAKILVEHHMDYQTIIGGLLHDVVEDTKINLEQVEEQFGGQIALLVDGVTKISGLKLPEFEMRQNENFRKMLLSMVKDIRVIMIKFADRLHNMRTLEVLPEDKRKRIARETRELYAPLAHRLGLARIKSELEDLALKYLHPEFYDDISRRINETKKEREEDLRNVTRILRKEIVAAKIHARFEGRAKHFYSIYNKIINRGVPFENIHDLLAVRIIVNRIEECYHALGIVHSLLKPIHERFKDYISTPKSNGYQSVHTIVVGPMGKKYEIQIRTEEMHRTAEEGIAAHWHYKEGRFEEDDLDKHLVWLRQILDTDEDDPDSSYFIENLKINLFQDEVFVFTPKGELHRLPVGSTPVDFAFYVHTEVGMHCMAAKVNGKIVPLSKKLNNGDTVEILTSSNKFPNKDWLQFTVTSKARGKIRKYIRDLEFKNSVSLGEEMLAKRLSKSGKRIKDLDFNELLKRYKFKDKRQFFASIGRGDTRVETVIKYLFPEERKHKSKQSLLPKIIERARRSSHGVRVAGLDNIMINFAKCCKPIPGEPITGIVTKGRGIVIHSNSCKNLVNLMQNPERIVEVKWDVESGDQFPVGLHILSERRKHFLSELSESINSADSNVIDVRMTSANSLFTCDVMIEVYDMNHLNKVIHRVKRLEGVITVERLYN